VEACSCTSRETRFGEHEFWLTGLRRGVDGTWRGSAGRESGIEVVGQQNIGWSDSIQQLVVVGRGRKIEHRRVVVSRGAGRIGGRRRHQGVAMVHRLEIVELVPKNLNFRIGVSQIISETLSLLLHMCLIHQLLLHQNLLL
jgi:hypothetical protein